MDIRFDEVSVWDVLGVDNALVGALNHTRRASLFVGLCIFLEDAPGIELSKEAVVPLAPPDVGPGADLLVGRTSYFVAFRALGKDLVVNAVECVAALWLVGEASPRTVGAGVTASAAAALLRNYCKLTGQELACVRAVLAATREASPNNRPANVEEIATRLGRPADEVAPLLDQLALRNPPVLNRRGGTWEVVL